jgi:2-dehydropantoate 2-reductase
MLPPTRRAEVRIAIVGVGAIGGWLAVRLAASGQTVCAFARGQTLDAIRRRGIALTADGQTQHAQVQASDQANDLGTQDLVVIAVKGPALSGVTSAVAALLHDETIVLPAMNGVPWWFTTGMAGPLSGVTLNSIDPEGRIAETVPAARVIGCVVHASCSTTAPGEILHANGNRLIVGEPDGAKSPRLARVSEVLSGAGLEVEASDHIQRDVWFKLWGNMTMNPISALTRALTSQILDDELVRKFALSVMAEASEIGRKIGCPISESGEDRMKITRRLGGIRTSMLQDAEAGRPLEIDALLAAPREIAARVGVATPHMDALHGLVRLYATVHSA